MYPCISYSALSFAQEGAKEAEPPKGAHAPRHRGYPRIGGLRTDWGDDQLDIIVQQGGEANGLQVWSSLPGQCEHCLCP